MIIIIIVAVILALFGIGFVVGIADKKSDNATCPKEQPETSVRLIEAEIDDEVLIYLEELHDGLRSEKINIIEVQEEEKGEDLQEAEIDNEIELATEIKRLLGQA